MKIAHLVPIVLLGLSACTTPNQAPQPAAVAEAIRAKNVLCSDLKPEAMAAHAECVAPTAVTEARCDEILPEFVQTYPACRAVALGGITLDAAHVAAEAGASLPHDVSVTSYSSQSDSSVISTTTSTIGGERSVSVTINGVTHTLSDSTGPTPLPDWNAPPP